MKMCMVLPLLCIVQLIIGNDGKQSSNNERERRDTACGTPTKLTAAQVEQFVTSHNQFRSKEQATNMRAVVWKNEVANLAQAWADQCKWAHGMQIGCGFGVGQNMYVESGSAGTGTSVTSATGVGENWYSERQYWSFTTGQCAAPPGKDCGHWTQMVSAGVTYIGCGATQCPTISGLDSTYNNGIVVVCNYLPGQQQGAAVYEAGASCTNCDFDKTGAGYKCNNNLCERCTPSTDSTCKCGTPLVCQNGGSWLDATCSCTCPKGFYGLKCENACSCVDKQPTACPSWSGFCQNDLYKQFMTDNCMATCKYPCDLPAICSA